jgi:hypothetical protein
MNCQDFEGIINDLAREQTVAVADRARAMVHGETCARCAARMHDEFMVTAALRSLSASADRQEAPPQVEGALRYAFRQQNRRPVRMVPARWQGWGGAVAMGAVAAGMLLVLAFTTAALRRPEASERKPAEGSRQVKPSRQNRIENAEARTETPVDPAGGTASAEGGDLLAMEAGGEEGFVPLQLGDDLADVDGAQVMRVEVPSAALVSLGLLSSQGDGAEGVEADVLLGQDGVAHAIRLVQ